MFRALRPSSRFISFGCFVMVSRSAYLIGLRAFVPFHPFGSFSHFDPLLINVVFAALVGLVR